MSDLNPSPRPRLLLAGGVIVASLALLIPIAFLANRSMKSAPFDPQVADDQEEANEEPGALITLTETQFRSLDIQVAPVQRMVMRKTTVVPGRLEYNQERHVSVKAPIDGVVIDLKRVPGDTVKQGDVLAIVSGPALAQSRAAARAAMADRRLAEVKSRVQSEVLSGIKSMSEMIDREVEPRTIEEAVAEQTVGDYREKLITAYTRARLAKQMADGSRTAASTGAIPQRTQQQRESEWQAADAGLKAVKEQAMVEATRLAKEADVALDSARRLVEIKMNELRTLLGPASQPVSESQIEADTADAYSEVTLVAPMAGTVEERVVAASERVTAGDTIYVVADTSQLWAVAQLRQRDWQAISIQPCTKVSIQSPALKDQTFQAEVKTVGRKVDPVTGSVPIIASLTSPNELLRPGLFIYVELPTGEARDVIAVPTQAVVAHDNRNYVFVQETPFAEPRPNADNESQKEADLQAKQIFRAQSVVIGDAQAGMIEIREGLTEGVPIAVTGAFELKSKWLIASEGDD